MKRLFIAYAWLLVTTGAILTSIAGWQFWHLISPDLQLAWSQTNKEVLAAQDSPSEGQVFGVSSISETEDARAQIVANFLERYDSPLQPYDYFGSKFVEIADRYGIDFRLLPAIAMQESNLCKKIPENTYNCLGFGIHAKGTLAFTSFEANFERAARELKANYIDRGLTTPEDIMRKYTPHSNGSWAASVNQWMSEMRYDDRSLGKSLKTNADVLEFAQASPTPENVVNAEK